MPLHRYDSAIRTLRCARPTQISQITLDFTDFFSNSTDEVDSTDYCSSVIMDHLKSDSQVTLDSVICGIDFISDNPKKSVKSS